MDFWELTFFYGQCLFDLKITIRFLLRAAGPLEVFTKNMTKFMPIFTLKLIFISVDLIHIFI